MHLLGLRVMTNSIQQRQRLLQFRYLFISKRTMQIVRQRALPAVPAKNWSACTGMRVYQQIPLPRFLSSLFVFPLAVAAR